MADEAQWLKKKLHDALTSDEEDEEPYTALSDSELIASLAAIQPPMSMALRGVPSSSNTTGMKAAASEKAARGPPLPRGKYMAARAASGSTTHSTRTPEPPPVVSSPWPTTIQTDGGAKELPVVTHGCTYYIAPIYYMYVVQL